MLKLPTGQLITFMPEDTPDTLYKYRAWPDSGKKIPTSTKRLLRKSELYFAAPGSFNDPFDSPVNPSLTTATDETIESTLRELYRRQFPHESDEEIRVRTNHFKEQIDSDGPELFRENLKQSGRRVRDDFFGVVSLTSKPDDMLMWAHYASSHTGICVGISTDALDNLILEHVPPHPIRLSLARAKYAEKLPEYDYWIPHEERSRRMFEVLCTKSMHWKYEDEYRLMMIAPEQTTELTNSQRKVILPDDAITEVVFGYRTSNLNVEKAKSILNKRGISPAYFRAEPKEAEFGLSLTALEG